MHREDLEKMFSRIEPDDALKNRIIDRMEDNSMKKSTKRSLKGIMSVAACVAVIGISTAFAAGSVISYFQSDNAIDITSMSALAEYNEEVGVTVSNFGYTLTLDNIATDDNFMHIFYTLKKDDSSMTENDYYNLWFLCRINGKLANFGNNNTENAYSTEDGSYKGVIKLNVADMEVPDTFTLEMYSEPAILKEESNFEGDYLYNDDTVLTDADKEKLLYISTIAKKTSVETKSVVKNVNKKFPLTYYDEVYDEDGNASPVERQGEGEISKVVFSPFGSQLVVKDRCQGNAGMKISGSAIFDENGQSLDVLNTDMSGGRVDVESINKIEILKADANTKALKIVPLMGSMTYNEEKTATQQIGTYPMTFKTSAYGSVVVTNIRFSDGAFEIDYYKDGFSLWDPNFHTMDKDGNIVEPGGKLGCLLTTTVHHDTNSYTAKYAYDGEYDQNGNKVPFDMSTISKENLEKTFTHLGIGYYDFELDYDNAIDINLK